LEFKVEFCLVCAYLILCSALVTWRNKKEIIEKVSSAQNNTIHRSTELHTAREKGIIQDEKSVPHTNI
jgi:hypothetical protein